MGRAGHPLHPPPRFAPGVEELEKRNIGDRRVCRSTEQKNEGKGKGARDCHNRCEFRG